nr:AAA family ATPase [bacterium]
MATLSGQISEIIYRNDQNGYTVLAVATPRGEATAVGCMPFFSTGEDVELEGEWTEHPEHGVQLSVARARRLLPATAAGIERFLASGIFPGIGKKTARLMVAAFGEDTLSVLADCPSRLTEIPGLGKKRAQQILTAYRDQVQSQETMVFLQSAGISAGLALRIFRTYGPAAVGIVRKNPYRLMMDVPGVGFKTADALARAIGLAEDDPFRLSAGLCYALEGALADGHTALPRGMLLDSAKALLNAPEALLAHALEEVCVQNRVRGIEVAGQTRYYLPWVLEAERGVAELLHALLRQRLPAIAHLDKRLAKADQAMGIDLADAQRDSLSLAAQSGVCVITGGPGTGKTTLIRALVHLFEQSGLEIKLGAPTGRAAKRLAEATGHEASTLHRLLEYAKPPDSEGDESVRPTFQRGPDRPLECDVAIIDEASMLDLPLFYHTLRALSLPCRLILVGDADQLPPVGAGQVLEDMLQSGVIPSVRLNAIFRQAAGSRIITNAHALLQGQPMAFNEKGTDCFLDRRQTPAQVADAVVDLCARRLPAAYGLSALEGELQVLAPMRRGEAGVQQLNVRLQQALNPPGEGKRQLTMGFFTLREGDRVLQTRNDYQLEWSLDGQVGTGVF